MKKWNIFLYMIVLVSTISCTITKRHHQPGFHVEWKKHISKKPNHEVKRVDTLSTLALGVPQLHEQEIAAVSPISSPPALPVPVTQAEPPRFLESTTRHQTQTDSHLKIDEERLVTTQSMDKSEKKDLNDEKPVRKTEPLTWVAFAVFVLAATFGIWAGTLFSSGFIIVLGMTFLGFSATLFFLTLATFIFALISAIRVWRNPQKYKNKAFTKVLFIISFLALVATGLIFLVAIYLDGVDFL